MPRPRKTNEAHLLEGTYNSTKHGVDAPMASGEIEAPAWMPKKAKKLFGNLKQMVSEKGLSHKEYSICLEELAVGILERNSLRDLLEEQGGPSYVDPKGIIRPNPTHKMLMERSAQVERLLTRFGLTPDTKSKVASKEATNFGGNSEEFFSS